LGNPTISGGGGDVSVSHASEYTIGVLLLPLAEEEEEECVVGCDLVHTNSTLLSHTLIYSHRIHTADELEQLCSHPMPRLLFLVYFALKEALAKALGEGLAMDLSRIDCSDWTVSSNKVVYCKTHGKLVLDQQILDHWQFHCSLQEEEYIVAIAARTSRDLHLDRLDLVVQFDQ
jgi:phosphopantetheinyl transferase